jgi:hypothetical protein
MVESKTGLVSNMWAELSSKYMDTNELCVFHCIIHEQNLCAKPIKFTQGVSKVVTCINLIKPRALNHNQFHQILEDMEAKYGNVIYFYGVWWLSKGKILTWFYGLSSEIFTFLELKSMTAP